MKKIIFLIFFFWGLSQANSYILENTDYNNYTNMTCYNASNNINNIIACIDDDRYIRTFTYNGVLIDDGDLWIYWSTATTSALRIFESNSYLIIMRNTQDWSVQYLHYYYYNLYTIINKNTWIIEEIINEYPYFWESANNYYIWSQYDGSRIKIFYNWTNNLISLYDSTYSIGTWSLSWYYYQADLKNQLYNNYTIMTEWGTWTYLREHISDGIYNFFSISWTGSLNYKYLDWTLTTLWWVSWLDYDWLRYTRVFTWSVVDYELILNQTAYSTWILDNETNDDYSILQNEFINENWTWNIIKNSFYTPLLWASGSTTYFINSIDNKLYKEGKINIIFSWSELTGTGWEFWTGSNTSWINLNFNCDTDNSWDIGIGEGLYCPIIYIRWIFDLFASWFSTIYEFIVRLVGLSPNI